MTDCSYDGKEFDELYEDIYKSCEWDCVREQEIIDEETGEKCILRYQELRPEQAYYSESTSRMSSIRMGRGISGTVFREVKRRERH